MKPVLAGMLEYFRFQYLTISPDMVHTIPAGLPGYGSLYLKLIFQFSCSDDNWNCKRYNGAMKQQRI